MLLHVWRATIKDQPSAPAQEGLIISGTWTRGVMPPGITGGMATGARSPTAGAQGSLGCSATCVQFLLTQLGAKSAAKLVSPTDHLRAKDRRRLRRQNLNRLVLDRLMLVLLYYQWLCDCRTVCHYDYFFHRLVLDRPSCGRMLHILSAASDVDNRRIVVNAIDGKIPWLKIWWTLIQLLWDLGAHLHGWWVHVG